MADILVDSNVLLDVFTEDPTWFEWSAGMLRKEAERHLLVINPVVYAEISIRFESIEDLEQALAASQLERRPIPWEAAFLAGKCFALYKRRGGDKRSPLPDFFIGAHAVVQGMTLLTRDTIRYRTYFPSILLIAPS